MSRCVDGELRRHLRDRSALVRVPRHLQQVEPPPLAALPLDAAAEAVPGVAEIDEVGVARALVSAAAGSLDGRERRVVALRYFLDLSQEEIGDDVGLSQVHVSRLLATRSSRCGRDSSRMRRSRRGRWVPRAALRSVAVTERQSYSGRLLLRMPRTLHAELARAAEREGTSLNQLIVGLLSRSVGMQNAEPTPGESQTSLDGAGSSPREPRGLRIALAINLAVVLLAAAIAVTLLIVAWRGGFYAGSGRGEELS